MIKYNKLIRDNIPGIIEKSGKKYDIEVLNDTDYLYYLNKKLNEEVLEYLESNETEELADLEEVIRAILDAKGVSNEEFENIRLSKVKKNGAFKKKLLLKATYEDEK